MAVLNAGPELNPRGVVCQKLVRYDSIHICHPCAVCMLVVSMEEASFSVSGSENLTAKAVRDD